MYTHCIVNFDIVNISNFGNLNILHLASISRKMCCLYTTAKFLRNTPGDHKELQLLVMKIFSVSGDRNKYRLFHVSRKSQSLAIYPQFCVCMYANINNSINAIICEQAIDLFQNECEHRAKSLCYSCPLTVHMKHKLPVWRMDDQSEHTPPQTWN